MKIEKENVSSVVRLVSSLSMCYAAACIAGRTAPKANNKFAGVIHALGVGLATAPFIFRASEIWVKTAEGVYDNLTKKESMEEQENG